jgi:drug/metabolite transporter (DMT)-like permease
MILPLAAFGQHPGVIARSSIFAAILLGVAGSGLAYLLYYDLLSRVASTHVVAVTYLLPIWGLFWGYIAHEPILWTAYMGVLLVIAGLALMNRPAAASPVVASLPSTNEAVACDAN